MADLLQQKEGRGSASLQLPADWLLTFKITPCGLRELVIDLEKTKLLPHSIESPTFFIDCF